MITPERRNKRNLLLENFFQEMLPYDDVKIIGSKDSPFVIVNDKMGLSCFVHNFNLRFTDQPFQGEVVHEHKLGTKKKIDPRIFNDWYRNAEHREAFTVKVKDLPLRVAGYNFTDKYKKKPEDKYAVFSEKDYKVYFHKENAEKVVKNKSLTTFELEVV